MMQPERHNTIKVLLFFDIGGSMDWHVKTTEELFSAAKTEFKHMVHLYFHNCLYEKVWKENRRRWTETTPTFDVLNTYPHDYKVIFVGDARCRLMRSSRPAARSSISTRRQARSGCSACRHLSILRLAQSHSRTRMGNHGLDPPDAAATRRADVSADVGGPGHAMRELGR